MKQRTPPQVLRTRFQHTYGCFGELFTGFLLPPLPGLEDPSHLGELAFAFGRRRAAAGVLVLPPRGALLQVGFIVCLQQNEARIRRTMVTTGSPLESGPISSNIGTHDDSELQNKPLEASWRHQRLGVKPPFEFLGDESLAAPPQLPLPAFVRNDLNETHLSN